MFALNTLTLDINAVQDVKRTVLIVILLNDDITYIEMVQQDEYVSST